MLYIVNNTVDAFHVYIYINAGAVTEPKNKLGISHMLEHMMYTTKKTEQIMDSVGRIGASINGVTDIDSTYYYIKSDVAFYKQALNFIMTLVFDADFSAHELDKERNVVFEEMYKSDGNKESQMIWDMSNLTVLPHDHLYMRKTIGTKETLESITISDLKKYYKKHYQNMMIVVNCPKSIVKPVEAFFQPHTQTNQLPTILPQIDTETIRQVIVFRQSTEQAMYVFTYAMIPERQTIKLRMTLELINHILTGTGMNSLLLKELRTKRGLVYSPYSSLDTMTQVSFFKIVIFSACTDIQKLVKIILDVMRMIKGRQFAKDSFSYYKHSFYNEQKTAFQSVNYTTEFLGDIYKNMVGCHERKVHYLSTADILSTIKSITHHDIVDIMDEYLSTDKLGVFAAGQFDKPQALAASILEMLE